MKRDELVVRAKRGDESAWAELHEKYCSRTEAVCFRVVRDYETARDLAQETFLKAWRKIKGFREKCAFSSWLYRIAHNISLMWLRRKRNHILIAGEEPYEGLSMPKRTDSDLRIDLGRAIGVLPRGSREVFFLHAVEGMSHREVAQKMNTSKGCSKSQFWRARASLRSALV